MPLLFFLPWNGIKLLLHSVDRRCKAQAAADSSSSPSSIPFSCEAGGSKQWTTRVVVSLHSCSNKIYESLCLQAAWIHCCFPPRWSHTPSHILASLKPTPLTVLTFSYSKAPFSNKECPRGMLFQRFTEYRHTKRLGTSRSQCRAH